MLGFIYVGYLFLAIAITDGTTHSLYGGHFDDRNYQQEARK